MNQKKAKEIRRSVYGELSLKQPKQYFKVTQRVIGVKHYGVGQIIREKLRQQYQQAKAYFYETGLI